MFEIVEIQQESVWGEKSIRKPNNQSEKNIHRQSVSLVSQKSKGFSFRKIGKEPKERWKRRKC